MSPFSSVGYYAAAAAFGAEIAAAAASFVAVAVAEVDKLAVAVGAAASFAAAADRTNIAAAVAFAAAVEFVQDIVVVGNCTAVAVVELACYIPQPSHSSAAVAAAAYLDCCCTSVAGAGPADIGAADMPSADPVVVEESGFYF